MGSRHVPQPVLPSQHPQHCLAPTLPTPVPLLPWGSRLGRAVGKVIDKSPASAQPPSLLQGTKAKQVICSKQGIQNTKLLSSLRIYKLIPISSKSARK